MKQLRWLWAVLALAGCVAHQAPEREAAPDESLTPAELDQVYATLLKGVAPGGPNHLHSRRLFHSAKVFAAAAGANLTLVQAAALLHDATKENGAGEPKERLCTHGAQGAELATQVLEGLGKSKDFAGRVAAAIREHMGPCGFNEAFGAKRFMSKFCARDYPAPQSVEAQVLYDLDMLDLMTVDGVVKVAELRQRNAEFGKEPLKDSIVSGADSAWKSVVDAQQTLITPRAKECGAALAVHTRRFVDRLDYAQVTDVAGLKAEAVRYFAADPLPSCLPVAPAWDGGSAL